MISHVTPRFTRLLPESLLFRFSVLSATVLILIAVGLGLVLERQVEHNALIRQADEVAVVVQDVLGNDLTAETFTGQPRIGSQERWAAKSRRLLLADGHVRATEPKRRTLVTPWAEATRRIASRFVRSSASVGT